MEKKNLLKKEYVRLLCLMLSSFHFRTYIRLHFLPYAYIISSWNITSRGVEEMEAYRGNIGTKNTHTHLLWEYNIIIYKKTSHTHVVHSEEEYEGKLSSQEHIIKRKSKEKTRWSTHGAYIDNLVVVVCSCFFFHKIRTHCIFTWICVVLTSVDMMKKKMMMIMVQRK